MITLFEAERVATDGWRTATVPAWTDVAIGNGWVVTVTPAGLRCDCGKGVLCAQNPRKKVR